MRAAPILTSFNGGELSPRMMGRVDQAIYQVATAEMLNFVPTIEGPAMKRSGFMYIRAAASTASWLSTFIFSNTQAYVLEWSNLALRFYTNGGRVETGPSAPFQVTTPYTAAEAPRVSTQQSYDRLYMAHANHPPASIVRTDATDFTYAALNFTNGPFATRNSDQAVLMHVNTGLTQVIATGGAPFTADDIGGYVMIEAMSFGDIKAWEPQARTDGSPAQLVVGDKRVSDGKVYQCTAIGGVRTGTIQPTHTRGEAWDGSGQSILGYDTQTAGVKWKYLYDMIGVAKITGFVDGSTVGISVTRTFPDSLVDNAGVFTASYRWSRPAISANADGWPRVVLLAFERLIFFTGFWMYASVVGDYGGGTVDMAPFSDAGLTAPDQAFSLRLGISNPVLWARLDRGIILLGTADGIWAVQKINASQTFSSDNVECVKQIHRGVSDVPPVQAGRSTIFVQAGGKKLRDANYDLQGDSYDAANLNVLQRHILKSGAVQLAFQGEPDELLFAARADGQLALHPHVPEQQIRGFARISHGGGPILSVCAIPGGDGSDQLWALVAGSVGRSVELLAPAWEEGETDLADAFFVDSGSTYSGAATTDVTGLDYLNGKAVAVLADGIVVTGKTVALGKITLDVAASTVQVGLPFTARLTSLRPEFRDGAGNTVQARKKRLAKLFLRLLETVGVKVDTGTGKVDELIDRPTSAAMDIAAPLFTGDTERPVGGSWGKDGQVSIISDVPLPCMVVAAMPTFEVGDA
jgi:hypothetical protein